jgi:ketosteroid isomerase-like protein
MHERAGNDHVQRLVEQWAAADLDGDGEFLASMLTDTFVGVGQRGFMLNKEQWVARYGSGDLQQEAFVVDELAVRGYGGTTIAIGRQTQRTPYQGRDVSGQFRVTLVCVRQAEGWLIAGLHLSGPLPDVPPNHG